MTDAEFQYVTGQARPGFAALFTQFEAQSADAIRAPDCRLDLRYGPAQRQVFDFFAAQGRPRGTLAYFHAGYWQSRDKALFRFIAPAFAGLGLNVALVNYPLCPSVSLGGLIEAVGASPAAIAAAAMDTGQPALPLILSGHSAGGHIAVELALAQAGGAGNPSFAVAGVIALSGIYDLVPLVQTTLNRNLMLDAAGAARHSPLSRVRQGCAAALFGVGAEETPAFLEQSRHMCEAWQGAGNRASLAVAPGSDHFSLLQQFVARQGMLPDQVRAFLDEVLG